MKLITETIKSKLSDELLNNRLDENTYLLINKIMELCIDLKAQELRNIESAFRTGWMTTDRWALNLEIYDHIKSRYDEDTMSYDQYCEEKKSADFFRKNFNDETE